MSRSDIRHGDLPEQTQLPAPCRMHLAESSEEGSNAAQLTTYGGTPMVQRAFISFDYDHDARLKDLLIGQSKLPDSPFEVHDWSIKTASPTWQAEARRRIRASGLVIVLCGKHTHTATGVGIELGITQDENVSYFLLAGYSDGGNTKPTTAKSSDTLYKWTWDNLKDLVDGAR